MSGSGLLTQQGPVLSFRESLAAGLRERKWRPPFECFAHGASKMFVRATRLIRSVSRFARTGNAAPSVRMLDARRQDVVRTFGESVTARSLRGRKIWHAPERFSIQSVPQGNRTIFVFQTPHTPQNTNSLLRNAANFHPKPSEGSAFR